jgi:hypothetical protein
VTPFVVGVSDHVLIVRSNGSQVNGWMTRVEKWFQLGNEFSVFGWSQGLIWLKDTGVGPDSKMQANEIFCGEIDLFRFQRFYLTPMPKIMLQTDPSLIDFDSLLDIADAAGGENACGE